jgi:hypothetical protein
VVKEVRMETLGIYRDAGDGEGEGGVLGVLQVSGVFRHPAVQAEGIEIVVGEEEDAVATVKENIAYLTEENRSLVRYR